MILLIVEWIIAYQVGCGAGNTIFPLLATYPDLFVHACDFSPRAVNLVKVRSFFFCFVLREGHHKCPLLIPDLANGVMLS